MIADGERQWYTCIMRCIFGMQHRVSGPGRTIAGLNSLLLLFRTVPETVMQQTRERQLVTGSYIPAVGFKRHSLPLNPSRYKEACQALAHSHHVETREQYLEIDVLASPRRLLELTRLSTPRISQASM